MLNVVGISVLLQEGKFPETLEWVLTHPTKGYLPMDVPPGQQRDALVRLYPSFTDKSFLMLAMTQSLPIARALLRAYERNARNPRSPIAYDIDEYRMTSMFKLYRGNIAHIRTMWEHCNPVELKMLGLPPFNPADRDDYFFKHHGKSEQYELAYEELFKELFQDCKYRTIRTPDVGSRDYQNVFDLIMSSAQPGTSTIEETLSVTEDVETCIQAIDWMSSEIDWKTPRKFNVAVLIRNTPEIPPGPESLSSYEYKSHKTFGPALFALVLSFGVGIAEAGYTYKRVRLIAHLLKRGYGGARDTCPTFIDRTVRDPGHNQSIVYTLTEEREPNTPLDMVNDMINTPHQVECDWLYVSTTYQDDNMVTLLNTANDSPYYGQQAQSEGESLKQYYARVHVQSLEWLCSLFHFADSFLVMLFPFSFPKKFRRPYKKPAIMRLPLDLIRRIYRFCVPAYKRPDLRKVDPPGNPLLAKTQPPIE